MMATGRILMNGIRLAVDYDEYTDTFNVAWLKEVRGREERNVTLKGPQHGKIVTEDGGKREHFRRPCDGL
jgi:hypothetical protein